MAGYCLRRTRRQVFRLLWALLFFLIGAGCGVVFFSQMQEDRGAWDLMDYVTLVVSGVIAVAALLGGLYEAYSDLRDVFAPGKSRLAKSIRSQMPYPEETPGYQELFAMVDRDIQEEGLWFDRVAVGREWVLGDEASAISRIRVVFGRDEIKSRSVNGRVQTARILELYILDDRRQVQISALRKPRELKALLECLRLRAPAALFRPYREYPSFLSMTEEEWEGLERDYQRRLHTGT